MEEHALITSEWPSLLTLHRLALALALGLFIGLEREWRGKEAGLRTFGFTALFGSLGGMLGPPYGVTAISLTGMLVAFLNVQSLRAHNDTELTTSAALLVTAALGVACGMGHTVTPAAIGVIVAGLLAWKESLAGFSHAITVQELRSAILLAIFAFAIYPVLPDAAIDRWGLINPRTAWVTVMLIAAMGFANYLLLKFFGARGIELTGFLGGLVNSTVTVAELANRVKDTLGEMRAVAYRSVLFATCAMAARNAAVLALLAWPAFGASAASLILMTLASAALAFLNMRTKQGDGAAVPTIPVTFPFSLRSVLKFGGLFLLLQVAGSIAQALLGKAGFYAVSLVGGLVSSASAVASAAALASSGKLAPLTAGIGSVIASLASAAVNLVLVARIARDRTLTRRLARALGLVLACGAAGVVLDTFAHGERFSWAQALRPAAVHGAGGTPGRSPPAPAPPSAPPTP